MEESSNTFDYVLITLRSTSEAQLLNNILPGLRKLTAWLEYILSQMCAVLPYAISRHPNT